MIKLIPSELLSGLFLLLCTFVAFTLANSGLSSTYQGFIHFHIGGHSLLDWVNDALMAIFFFSVGLEIKREVLTGHLSTAKKGLLPVLAACGGATIPALIYLKFNPQAPASYGWGIPMATDIAFAVGILSLLGKGIPGALKTFLLALAIADDLIAILVIAFFYGSNFYGEWFYLAICVFGLFIVLNRLKFWNYALFVALSVIAWYAIFRSGIHATIAGVVMGLLTPDLDMGPKKSPLDHMAHLIHPWVTFGIMPIFAFFNAGVDIRSIPIASPFANSVFAGVFFGLVLGKPIGVFISSFAVVKLKLCELPHGVHWFHIVGAGFLAGIGFTMALFIDGLAFKDQGLQDIAKFAILMASITASLLGAMWFMLKRLNKKN